LGKERCGKHIQLARTLAQVKQSVLEELMTTFADMDLVTFQYITWSVTTHFEVWARRGQRSFAKGWQATEQFKATST
jgi:hypothetical protein